MNKHIRSAKIYTAKHVCFSGYQLVGSNERKCSPDGMLMPNGSFLSPNTWSGPEPKCQIETARSSLTTEKDVVIKNHIKHTYKTCEKVTSNRKKPYTLIEAINICEFQNCSGVLDEYCDGTKIFLCADVFPAENDDPKTNGCTYIKNENKCCSNILIESNSQRSSIHSDIWGKYSISNQAYKDNRDGVTTYLNSVNGLPFFGGKGRKNFSWQIHEDYGNKDVPPKLINFSCKEVKCPEKCTRTWHIVDDNKIVKVIDINITCVGEIRK